MKNFTKNEAFMLFSIFTILFVISFPNFLLSIKRSRDMTRKDDLGSITKSLVQFHAKYKVFPDSSEDGKIIACLLGSGTEIDTDGDNKIDVEMMACEWGQKSVIGNLPQDPKYDEGNNYFYVSNGNRYQIFTSLEAKDDDEYMNFIEERNIKCGSKICNAGRAYSDTPLDKTLEEYEDELYEKNNK